MRKQIAFFLAIVLIAAGLTGCRHEKAVAAVSGYSGEIRLEARLLEDGRFEITVMDHSETYGLGSLALDSMVDRINQTQSLSVDAVSGATTTSQATLNCAGGALDRLGVDIEALRNQDNYVIRQSFAYDCDVVIVGGGGAGLTAAIAARQAGMNVMILEKQGVIGGSTIRSDGMLSASGSYLQSRYRVQDTSISYASYLFNYGDPASGSFRQLELAQNSAANIELLQQWGITFSDTLYTDDNCSTPRNLLPTNGVDSGGNILLMPLYEQARQLGVEIFYNTRASEILVDYSGAVNGVRARASNGNTVTVYAPAVILATGGYDRNADLVEELAGLATGLSVSSPGSTGDGISMARQIGAGVYDYGALMASLDDLKSGLFTGGGLIVTPQGERFCNELEDSFSRGTQLMLQGYSTAWKILDGDALTNARKKGLDDNNIVIADSIEALAEAIDAPQLADALNSYNALCQTGKDADYNKPAEDLQPINSGPYAAALLELRSYGSTGGLVTNSACQVLSTASQPISGLYAAGETANGAYFASFPGFGSSLAQVIDTGRIAGEAAAEYARAEREREAALAEIRKNS